MLLSAIPYKFLEIFGKNAPGTMITTPIPQTTVSGIRASQDLGFPVLTATAIGAGGTPPDARDFNGVLQYLSAWAQWQQAGGPLYYDSAFSTAIGGYPAGTILSNASIIGSIWVCLIDNNTSNPDAGGANWIGTSLTTNPFSRVVITATGAFSGTVPSWAARAHIVTTGAGAAAGGGDNVYTAGGGGAGGTAIVWVSVTGGASYSGNIGAGGTCASGASNGTNGGNSTFVISSVTYTGLGGGGGIHAAAPAGGAGGTATNGDINVIGGAGTDGWGGAPSAGGNGGASFWGGGGRSATAAGAVQNGAAFGSGGGAGYFGAVILGGSGANGICQIEFFS